MSSIDRDVRMATDSGEICNGSGLASNKLMVTQSGPSADMPFPAGSKASAERNADHISRFLEARRPALFCDDCIADKLALSHRREANRITRALAKTSKFWRDVGACTACDKHKQVIRNV